MSYNSGIYCQGAMITYEDFEPGKVIPYFCKLYGVNYPDGIENEVKSGDISDENFDYLCEKLEAKPAERTLQALCEKLLNPYEISDIFADDAEVKVGNDMISAWRYTDIIGEFCYDDENRLSEFVDGECMILCFNIPYVWNIRDAIIPADRRIAVFQLQQATKQFLKDDIDWNKRLGSLLATKIYSSI